MDYSALLMLAEKGGAVGLVLATIGFLAVITIGTLLRNKAVVTLDEKAKLVNSSELAAIAAKLGDIDKRMANVEHDVSGRATRDEVHKLELSFTRMEGRFDSVSATTQATANAVGRIEEFMYAAALRAKDAK